MRILEVLPTYPGDEYDGSAVYERSLNGALIKLGSHIEVLTTRARRLRHGHEFSITWPDELPARDSHDGALIRRFHALDTSSLGHRMSEAVSRRWSREAATDGFVIEGSSRFIETAVSQARSRPRRFDMLADIGRGPVVPSLVAHLVRCASRYDIVVAGYAPFSLSRQVLWAASRSAVPVVLLPFIHENDRHHQFRSLLRTYERAAAVLTLSGHTSDFLHEHVPLANPVTVGAGFTNPPGGTVSGAEFRARYDLNDRPILLFVGRKEKGKRYDLAIDAVKMLRGNPVLVMVGRDIDGRVVFSDRVRQLGMLSDQELAAAYEACDIFVLPSLFESFGMVFLDAWLRAKPVIGNRACGASAALIEDGVDGFLCSNATEIAATAQRLLDSPDARAKMGAAGRAKTLAEYTWEQVAERVMTAFRGIIGPPSMSNAETSRATATQRATRAGL
jgi:glycosyltransferase involved in cell wall biosynthesis